MANMLPTPNNTVIVRSTIPILILAHVKTADTIAPRMCVQSAGDGNADDLLEIIYGCEDSKLITGWVLYNEANKATLGSANSRVTKATTFAAGDHCWIGMRVPAIEAILSTGQGTILPGQLLVCGGAGMVKVHSDTLYDSLVQSTGWGFPSSTGSGNMPLDPTIGKSLSYLTTADATQVIQIVPLW